MSIKVPISEASVDKSASIKKTYSFSLSADITPSLTAVPLPLLVIVTTLKSVERVSLSTLSVPSVLPSSTTIISYMYFLDFKYDLNEIIVSLILFSSL